LQGGRRLRVQRQHQADPVRQRRHDHLQDVQAGRDTLGGATLHWVGYDEPPPREHRDEAMTRLLVHDGYEMFAMTPLKVNTGWIRRDIYKQPRGPRHHRGPRVDA
jgi:phage terminase large subunit-like protein